MSDKRVVIEKGTVVPAAAPVPDGERVREYERLRTAYGCAVPSFLREMAVAGTLDEVDQIMDRLKTKQAALDAFILPLLAQPAASKPLSPVPDGERVAKLPPFDPRLQLPGEYEAGRIIREAVDCDDEGPGRFYLTCSVGELAQRLVASARLQPAAQPIGLRERLARAITYAAVEIEGDAGKTVGWWEEIITRHLAPLLSAPEPREPDGWIGRGSAAALKSRHISVRMYDAPQLAGTDALPVYIGAPQPEVEP